MGVSWGPGGTETGSRGGGHEKFLGFDFWMTWNWHFQFPNFSPFNT